MKLQWEELHSRAVFPFLVMPDMRVVDGRSTGEFELELELGDVKDRGLRVSGRAAHHHLTLEQTRERSATTLKLELPRLALELSEFFLPIPLEPKEAPDPVRVHVSKIEIEAPRLEVRLGEPPSSLDTGEPADDEDGAVPDDAERGLAALTLRLDHISVQRGSLRVSDAAGQDYQEIKDISVEAQGLRWPGPDFEHIDVGLESLGTKALVLEWVLAELGDRSPPPGATLAGGQLPAPLLGWILTFPH